MTRLFDIEQVEKSKDYVNPSVKRKWTKAFIKWCNDKYFKEGDLTGIFCCGNMKICDECKMKYQSACKDCVETIKQIFKDNNIKINYNDYDFEKVLNRVEKLEVLKDE